MNYPEKILLVDDELLVIEALQRALREFRIEIAEGAEKALAVIENSGPFAVVVSDLRMPEVDGIQFLTRVKAISPDTVRVMLTGQADLNAAIAAVNEGNIFRFLTKPCPAAQLGRTLEAAIEQYRLVTAERELLQRTLMGSVTVLTEILSVIYPAAFSRSARIRSYVSLISKNLGMGEVWQFQVASILSQIGWITLPSGTADKMYTGAELSDDERRLFARHPRAAASFLRSIPRLESVAQMIAAQQKPYCAYDAELEGVASHTVTLGSQMLHVAIDLDRLVGRGMEFRDALRELRSRDGEYHPELLAALEEGGEPAQQWRTEAVAVEEVDTTMVANEDIRALNGMILLAQGQPVTYPLLERLRGFAEEIGVVEPVRVLVPEELHSPETAAV